MRKRFTLILLVVAVALGLRAADRYANLSFVVVKADNGKPVRNASIVLHPVKKDGKQAYSGLELKTDPDGKASYAGVPFGKLRIQVLMRGFQTYGEDFEINQPNQEITIKLHRPKQQYSIYDDKPSTEEKKQDQKPK